MTHTTSNQNHAANNLYEGKGLVDYLLSKGWKRLGEDLFLHDCALHAVDGVLALVMQRHRDRVCVKETVTA